MKRLFCLMISALMILSMAACGKGANEETTIPVPETPAVTTEAETTVPETTEAETTEPETTEPETTEPETTEPETTAGPVTDKEAKPEDVLKAAAEALSAEDIRFAFTVDPVLDLSLFYKAPEKETTGDGDDPDTIGMIAEMLFDRNGELNVRLEPKTVGFYEAKKGVEAEVEFKNNLSDRVRTLLAMMLGLESQDDPSIAWLTDEIKTSLYVDLTKRIVYFLNPVSEKWNYSNMSDATEAEDETETAVPEEIDLDQLFEEHEWKITDDQYVLSGKVNAKELSGASADQLPENAALRLTLVFNAEKKLTDAELVMDPFGMDLSGLLPGFSFELKQFSVKGTIDYETPEFFGVPSEISENAVKYEGDIPFISGESDDSDTSGLY